MKNYQNTRAQSYKCLILDSNSVSDLNFYRGNNIGGVWKISRKMMKNYNNMD